MASEILEGKLYLGSADDAQDKELLEELGIQRILNCAIEAAEYFPDDFQYLSLGLQDYRSQELEPVFKKSFLFIDQAIQSNEKILVHCIVNSFFYWV
jgi:protein-tyrosine phosphatase